MADIYKPIGENAVEKYADTGTTTADGRAIVAKVVASSGGSGSATSAKQDEQTGYLTSISSDSASIVTTLGDTTGNPDPHTTAWYLKQVHGGLGTIDGNVSNIKDNVASVLPYIGLDTAAIRAQIPASLGAKTAANSLSVAIASDAIAYGTGNVTGSTQRVTLANDGFFATSISGFSDYRNTALTNTAVSVKSSGGSLRGWTFINQNTSAVYIKIYNALAGSVTVGTTTPVMVITIPAGTASDPAVFFLETQQVEQRAFTTGIAMAAVTGIADNNNTAPSIAIYSEVRFK